MVAIETEGVCFAQVNCEGISNTFAIDKDGNIWACGKNTYAQVGDSTKVTRAVLQQITEELRFVQVSSACSALDEFGDLWWWGLDMVECYRKFKCIHFEEKPDHDVRFCEGYIALEPEEAECSKANGLKFNFYYDTRALYAVDKQGAVWVWTGNSTVERYLGNGRINNNSQSFETPIKIFDEEGVPMVK
jgi:alpha-tubulin suppressor-like RCC1 family protein